MPILVLNALVLIDNLLIVYAPKVSLIHSYLKPRTLTIVFLALSLNAKLAPQFLPHVIHDYLQHQILDPPLLVIVRQMDIMMALL